MATRYASITGGVGVPRTFIGGVTGGAGIAESNGLFYTYSFSGPSLFRAAMVANAGHVNAPAASIPNINAFATPSASVSLVAKPYRATNATPITHGMLAIV
jgi:hypothetical protein